jgi:hypothetical protein
LFFKLHAAPFRFAAVNFFAMHAPVPYLRHSAATEPPALVRVITREDVMWNRPVFKAPPLAVQPPVFDAQRFASEVACDDR